MPRTCAKSHLGCRQCKRRKVKCDEVVPACGNCVRREEQCSFLEYSKAFQHLAQSPPSDYGSPGNQATRSPRRSLKALLELELTQFFLMETLPSIVCSPIRLDIWRRSIFPHGVGRPEVLNAHLATAALHKVATLPASHATEYLQLAAEYQADALSTFLPMLSSPCADNAGALFVLAALVTIWAFASGSLPPELNITSMLPFGVTPMETTTSTRLTDLISIIKVARGIQAVVQQCRPWLSAQGLGTMIKGPDVPIEPAPNACNALDNLMIDLGRRPDVSPRQFEAYAAGIGRTKSYMQRVAGDANKEVVLSWPVGLSQGFVEALSLHEPAALVILAFWAASLHDTPRILWWARGWGKTVVAEIRASLDETWWRHLDWPVMTVMSSEYDVAAESIVSIDSSMVFGNTL